MQTDRKQKTSLPSFSPEQKALALALALPNAQPDGVDWEAGAVTAGGGVVATIQALRKSRGPNKKPVKTQVAVRLDADVLSAFKAGGPGWQTRMNAALKDWLIARR